MFCMAYKRTACVNRLLSCRMLSLILFAKYDNAFVCVSIWIDTSIYLSISIRC